MSREWCWFSRVSLEDHPTFAPLNPLTHPQENPPSATHELISRYLNLHSAINKLRSVGLLRSSHPAVVADSQPNSGGTAEPSSGTLKLSGSQQHGLDQLRELIRALQRNGVAVGVVQFWERDEMMSGIPRPEHPILLKLFREMNLPVVQSDEYFRRCSPDPPRELYVAFIHPFTPAGQRCLADAIEAVVKSLPQ